MNKKLIEVALPLEAINIASAREKSIRHGHPSTLHLWWARRPLAAARAVIFAQMVDDPSSCPDLFPTEKEQEKGRVSGADTITVTRNEILYSLNKPDDFILVIVEFVPDGTHRIHYLNRPFQRVPDFGVTSVNYDFAELLARAEEMRMEEVG